MARKTQKIEDVIHLLHDKNVSKSIKQGFNFLNKKHTLASEDIKKGVIQ